MAITTATSASAAAPTPIKGEPASPPASSNDSTPKTTDAAASTPTLTGNTAPAGTPPKRRAARRANTAERRATHNAVERMRRETLNGRFLTLASLLPPLAALRRPSKAAIVSSSIATVNAAARHRVLAAQTLRSLAREAEQLRREVNEWRARARVPQLDVPVRSDAHNAVLRAEIEDFELELDADVSLEEDGDEGDEPNDNHDNNSNSNEAEASPVSPAVATPSPAAASPQQLHATAASIKRARSGSASAHGFYTPSPIHTAMPMAPPTASGRPSSSRFAFGVDVPPASPSSASSASGSAGWDGPGTPPSSAGMHMMHPAMMGGKGYAAYEGAGMGGGAGAGAAYDLGLGFDGEEGLLFGGGASGVPMGVAGLNSGMMGAGMGMGAGGAGGIGSWAHTNPSHPAFHLAQAQAAHHLQAQQAMQVQQQMRMREAYEQQAQLQAHLALGGVHMGMPMGAMGVPVGVAQGQYLHQQGLGRF